MVAKVYNYVLLLALSAILVASATAHSDDSTRHLTAVHPTTMKVGSSAGLGRKLLQDCWTKVAPKEPCQDGWVLYCCDGDGADANCLGPADNTKICSSQYDQAHAADWCKNNSC